MLSRRVLLKTGLATCGFELLPHGRALGAAAAEPHFFLTILFPGGLDHTYAFDPRPLALRAANVQANYSKAGPVLWRDAATEADRVFTSVGALPLKAWADELTIVRGVTMATTFDGHTENQSFLLGGNPFGGDSLFKTINVAQSTRLPLDFVRAGVGKIVGKFQDPGAGAPLNFANLSTLQALVAAGNPMAASSSLARHLSASYARSAAGGGRFSSASNALEQALTAMPSFAARTARIEMNRDQSGGDGTENPSTGESILASAGVVAQIFRNDLAKSAFLVFDTDLSEQNIDAHDAGVASILPGRVEGLMRDLAGVLALLRRTPYDGRRSVLDVTTVMIATEFARTYRQDGLPIDASGTDHNSLTNTILFMGKGIKGGGCFGAGDFHAPGEALSKAHLALDPTKLKSMGRPFDFKSQRVRSDAPAAFDPADYLSAAVLANTMFSLFGVPKEDHWLVRRGGDTAPVLSGLLS